VFVVASARAGFDPAAVLLEFEGLRRDTPPRRETGQGSATGAAPCTDERRSHWDGIENPHPTLNQSFNTGAIGYSNQELFSQRGAGLVGEASTGDVSHCLNAGGMGRQDYETETLVTHALRGEGFDASEDGTGRGTPLVPVAFSAKDHGADATEDLSPTLRAMPHDASHANGGGQMAVALPLLEVGKRTGPSSTNNVRAGLGIGEDGDPMFTLQAGAQHGVAAYAFQPRIARNGRGDMGDLVNALTMSGETGKGDTAPCVALPMMVRRLTCEEAESLQGFSRRYTRIPWKKKHVEDCPDGPRYRALGNSMAVNVMRWIGERIRSAVGAAEDGRVP
jgi:DNA (cytosine-5)-methyltransferase 1